MGNRARRWRRRPASGDAGGSASKRPRWVAEEEEEEEEEEDVAEGKMEGADGEDLCFVCKDGGDLRVCDYRGCHKAYHPLCVGKDADFLNSDEEFICEWHTCYICEGRSRYYCFCCPWHTFCKGCVAQAEFVPVLRKTKGFCRNCLRMAIMVEKNVDVDSDGEKADFNDRETYEFLFKEYWEIIRDKEGITLDKLEKAYAILKKGQNCKQDPDLERLPDEDQNSDDDFVRDSDDDGEEPSSRAKLNGMTMKIKSSLKEGKSMRNGFVGWGSKELIEFLLSIGKDTSATLDQCHAAEVVKDYIRQNSLLQKGRKKNVICDDKLQSLFRKSKVKYNKIYYLLEKHIAANMLSEDESNASSEDNSDSVITKKARNVSYRSSTLKRTPEINKRCFAALVRDNINLIYLRRSLVMDLLKEPDTFESKVIGSFVRIKNDPKDYSFHMHKKLYQLGRVTGIRKTSEEYKIEDILLCISNLPDVKISMLSDEDFDEEECQDLRLLAQNGSLLRYTVGDLEEKARSLRRNIMSHWINRELQRLDRLIDKASEKGWRQEKNEYLDKKQLLRKPSEQQRLLEEVPRVIPEIEDSKDTEVLVTRRDKSTKKSTVSFQGTNAESIVSLKSCSEEKYKGTNGTRASILKSCTEEKIKGTNAESIVSFERCSEEKYKGTNRTRASFLKSCAEEKFKGTDGEKDLSLQKISEEKSEATNAYTNGGTAVMPIQKQSSEANNICDIPSVQNLDTKGAEAGVDGDTAEANVQSQSIKATKANTAGDVPATFVQKQVTKVTDVITIEDDDDDDDPREKSGQRTVVDLEADDVGDAHHLTNKISRRGQRNVKVKGAASQPRCIWYYIDPQGDEQGPFSMEHLRGWWNGGFFPWNFRVWRTGQTSDNAILLSDALQMIDS